MSKAASSRQRETEGVTRSARAIPAMAEIAPDDWAQLDHQENPFLSYAFLLALERSGSVTADSGWQPHHLCLCEGDRVVAAAPSYLKFHSHGEFVFDWSWADAYQRYGKAYYPKLLTAVPYSPIPGRRLLVRRDHPHAQALRCELVEFALATCRIGALSSWHCNFTTEQEAQALSRKELLPRSACQFHWFKRGYTSFEDFLAHLRAKKRKNILRDRRLVHAAGIRFVRRRGDELSASERDFVFACYQQTFLEYGNHPALNRAFFDQLYRDMAAAIVVVLAQREGQPIAMSFFLQGGGRLYGRYWGCLETHSGLHFETAYHQGIEYCIDHGLQVFEPGAQGEHKISRGFEPVLTRSFHHIQDPIFGRAIGQFLQREGDWVRQYRHDLAEHNPFRSPTPDVEQ